MSERLLAAIPSHRLPELAAPVAAVVHEGEELPVRHRRLVDAEPGTKTLSTGNSLSQPKATRERAPSVAVPAGTRPWPVGRRPETRAGSQAGRTFWAKGRRWSM